MKLWKSFFALNISLIIFACEDSQQIEQTVFQDCHNHFKAASYKVALKRCEKAAKLGLLEAQWLLAQIYDYGLAGDEAKPDKAFQWYLKAAEGGLSDAQTLIGESYLNANGVKQDYAEAYRWLIKAAKQGDLNAEFYLGNLFLEGKGRKKDVSSAISWFKKSAAKRHLMSINNLAWIYATSEHKAFRDVKKAKYWADKLQETDENQATFLDTKAAVYALDGNFSQAVALQNKAIASLSEDVEEAKLLDFQRRLEAYENNQAWLESSE
ncbi:tetratricopeptide repeat protein [Aliikangiella sp. IMCC44359]|uniref:tetratricopeptide repeat protein n=1 Tax=Aliikangiella sp. IMCC44359 TaxID=3459125 RepID=UPI00403A9D8B